MSENHSLLLQHSPIFLGGCPRSGTTLLRVMLDSHPDIACGSELRLVHVFANLWRNIRDTRGDILREHFGVTDGNLKTSFADQLGNILERHRVAQGKSRVAEKTPANVTVFPLLRELFPASPLIHVIRDGRDVVASLLGMSWHDERSGKPMDIVSDVHAAATTWVECVSIGRSVIAEPGASAHYHEIRYEELIQDPVQVLRKLLEFLGLQWNDAVLEFHNNPRIFAGTEESSASQVALPLYASAVGRWRRDLTTKQLESVMTVAGLLLAELGYCRQQVNDDGVDQP